MSTAAHLSTEHLKADLKGRSVRGVAVTLGAQAVKFALGLGSTMILARLLSPKDYGLIAMVGAVTNLVGVIKDGGLSAATVQRADVTDAQVSTLFWINAALGLLVALLVAALSPFVAWFYGDPALLAVTLVMAIPFVLGGLTVQHQALLQRQMRFKALSAIDIVSLVVSLAVGIGLAATGFRYWALVAMPLVAGVIWLGLAWAVTRWKPAAPTRGSGVRSMIRFGGGLTLNNLFHTLGATADKLLLGKFVSAEVLGYYTRAQALMLQPMLQIMPTVQTVVLPAMSRLAENLEQFRRAFRQLLQVITIACSFVAAFLIVGADWLVRVFLGPQWTEAGVIFRYFAVPVFMVPINTLCVQSLIARGRGGDLVRWGLLNNSLLVAAILAGLPWGAVGVAASASISALCLRSPLLFHLVAKSGAVQLGEIWRVVGPGLGLCAAASAVMVATRWLGNIQNPLLGLGAILIVNGAVHAAILTLLPAGRAAVANVKSLAASLRPKPTN